MILKTLVAATVCSQLLASTCLASSTFYDNESDWLAATANVQNFDTTPEHIALSNEVTSPPYGNEDLGSVLTFEAAQTGLPWGFRLTSTNVPPDMVRGLVYDDSEAGLGGARNISIGDADGVGDPATRSLYENDDWSIEILSGPALSAFAFRIVGNDQSLAESLQIFSGPTLLGVLTDLATSGPNNTRFLGVVSTEPITHIVFDEDEVDPGPDFDDIAIRDFRFADKALETAVEKATWAGIKALFR